MAEKTFGIGTRDGQVFELDTNGLPAQAVSSATPEQGEFIEGIKTFVINPAAPRRFTHAGNDRALVADSLPSLEQASATVTTSKTNKTMDAFVEGNLVRDYTTLEMRVVNSDRQGREPQVMIAVWRQAIAGDPSDLSTYGKVRNYEGQIIPSTRVSVVPRSYGADLTDQTYECTLSSVRETPWGEDLLNSTFGSKEGPILEFTTIYEPRFLVYKGDGANLSWTLPVQPVGTAYLHVWVGGSLTAPGSVTYNGTLSAFTIPGTVAAGVQIFAIAQHSDV